MFQLGYAKPTPSEKYLQKGTALPDRASITLALAEQRRELLLRFRGVELRAISGKRQ
jgi:hypothetical protein